jgi:hypothetical protein
MTTDKASAAPQGRTQPVQGHQPDLGVAKTATRALASIKPIPRWADASLSTSYKTIFKAKRKGDAIRLAEAQRNVARIRHRFALQRLIDSTPYLTTRPTRGWQQGKRSPSGSEPRGAKELSPTPRGGYRLEGL